jgi:type I restriction enzyme R subunit
MTFSWGPPTTRPTRGFSARETTLAPRAVATPPTRPCKATVPNWSASPCQGLVVDYIGIAQNLKSALGQYSQKDQEKTGIDEGKAISALKEKYEIVRDMFHGFNYKRALGGTPQARLSVMAEAIGWILDQQNKWAQTSKTPDDKKRAHRRYQDAVLALSVAFSLTSASAEAQAIRDEVGFFQAIREALVKSVSKSGKSKVSCPGSFDS